MSSLGSKMSYWERQKGGPKLGCLVFADGSKLNFNLTDRESYFGARNRLPEAVGLILLAPAGSYSGEFLGPKGNTYYTSNSASEDEAVSKLLADLKKLNDELAAREANPELALDYELARHDWYYHYSDDHRVWVAGESQWKKIKGLLDKVSPEKAKELWEAHAPKEFKFPLEAACKS